MALIPMGEAAQRSGVSVDTIRRGLRKGELQAQQRPTPQGFIWLVLVAEPSDLAPMGTVRSDSAPAYAKTRAVTATADPAYDTTPTDGFRELVDVLRQPEAKDGQLESKDRQIEQLHLLRKQVQPVLPAYN